MNDEREPYEAPTVEDVPMRPEEQLLAGCKQPGGGAVASLFGCQLIGGQGCSTASAS